MKSLKILGMKYKIIEVSENHKELHGEDGNYYAVITHKKNNIYIRNNMSKKRYDSALLHEVIHAVDAELKLDLTEDNIMRLTSGLRSAGVHIDIEH